MKKILCCLIALSLLFFNYNSQIIYAAEVAHAASQAEAQTLLTNNITTQNDTFYTFIGSGFTGFGENVKVIYENILNKMNSSFIQNNPTKIEPQIDNQTTSILDGHFILNEEFSIDQIIKDNMTGVTPKPMKMPVTLPKDIKDKEIEKPMEEAVKEDKVKDKEETVYLPVTTEDGEELAALLEGEIVGKPFLGINATTYKVMGATLAITGIVFLILGTSGVFSSASGSNSGSGQNPGEGENGINGLPIIDDTRDNGNNQSNPVIPEPGMLYLIISGLFGLFVFRRFHL